MAISASGNPCPYDVYFTSGGRRFYFRNPNHGVTLTDDGIAWTIEDRDDEAAFANLASVHLQSGGSPQDVIDQCTLELADGMTITVSNGNASGLPDATQKAIYRAFVQDLHARLAAGKNTAIRFTAGYAPGRYQVVLVCAIALSVMFVALPLVLLFIVRDSKVLGLLIAGGLLCWPLAKMVQNNSPRDYSPDQLPDELLS
jgi:hypothetical protein